MTWMVILELRLIIPYLYFNMVILLRGQKYGYMVLHPDMIHKLNPGQDTSYRNMSRDLYHFNLSSLYMMILITTSTI